MSATEQGRTAFVDPVRGVEVVLVVSDGAAWDSIKVQHPGCDALADVSCDLDAFYCPVCRWNGRVSGAWAFDQWAALAPRWRNGRERVVSAELCLGSGQPAVRGWCGECMAVMPSDPSGGPLIPPHTVDAATGEVWVQVAPPKPPEPDPWAVALHEAWWGDAADLIANTAGWEKAHRAAAKARELARTDAALRAEHWREAAEWASTTTNASASIFAGADRIERGEQP